MTRAIVLFVIALGAATLTSPVGAQQMYRWTDKNGRVHITSQNHGYAVDGDRLPSGVQVSLTHLNDGTVEGLIGRDYPLITIQYHSEASPGPLDNMYIFENFVELIKAGVRG